jgi:cation diffusion facilitator CzcD-associated flavoprotein CzcO
MPGLERKMTQPLDAALGDVPIAIIGSGFSGLGMAIRLKQEGIHDFAILEREHDVGGTWHVNTYPGCTCDVPSHLYSFSFAPNPEWSHTYSPQPEIRRYLRRCAEDYGVLPHVRFGHEVTSSTWDEAARRWVVETSAGTLRARILITGIGAFSEPSIPDFRGLHEFEGETLHTARWNRDRDLTGERVAVIGTGASAIQVVPSIQPKVSRLHVFQRTPPWIVPHSNRPLTRFEQRLYRRFPAAQRAVRGGVYATREALALGFVKDPRLMRVVELVSRRHIAKQVKDPALRRKVTPTYTIGCKRILPSNDWYPALSQPNVELVTDRVAQVRPRSIVTADGVEREVDTIVLGTGFKVADMPVGRHVRGRGGVLLDDAWQGSPRAHMGSTISGFPNFFMLLGPNTGLGHSSMVYMAESQIAYVLDAVRRMRAAGIDAIEVRPEAQERYVRSIDERMRRTVWSTGCSSWYLDRTGRNATQWPDWTWRFRRLASRFDAESYLALPPAPPPLRRAREAAPAAAGVAARAGAGA